MRRGHIPYRGEVRPKLYGHPSPPDPNEKGYTYFFWFLLILIGLIISYTAVNLAIKGNFEGVFGLIVYLMLVAIIFFATRDIKKIKMMTPDIENGDQNQDDDASSLAEDYLAQLEWASKYGRIRRLSHSYPHEPKWRYQPVFAKNNNSGRDLFFIAVILIVFLMAAIAMVISNIFGPDSPIITIVLIVIGILGVGTFLIKQG